MGPCSISTISL
ncbi:hypothetical protein LINGRAHAP2_LOCUS7709 [Linum grandiflorum]